MAQIFAASIYGCNGNSWVGIQGKAMAFPATGVVLRQLAPVVNYGGVDCTTEIQLLPTGPSPIQPVYYTPTAIGTLVTAINT